MTISSTSGIGTIDRSKLIDFFNTCEKENIKTITFTNTVNAPQNCSALFRDLKNLTSINTNNLDVNNVDNMWDMFMECRQLNALGNLGNWNTSNVKEMSNMFNGCSSLTAIEGIDKWDTSNVTSMEYMFQNCKELIELDISNWNTSNLKSIWAMFNNCSELITVGDLSNWDTSKVTKTGYMFYFCRKLTNIGDIGGWDVSKVTSMTAMFEQCNNLITVGDLSDWDVSNVKSMASIFNGCQNLTTIGDISNWNTSSVTNMAYMIQNCYKLTTIGDLGNWDISSVTNMINMFCGLNLTTVGDLSNWNTSNITNMEGIFNNCKNLTTVGDLSNWDTSKVTTMRIMFRECKNLITVGDISNWNTSNVTNMEGIFYNCENLTTVEDLRNWDTSKVTDMSDMFYNCKCLTTVENLSKWNTQNVTTMYRMFKDCNSLTSLKGLNSWNTTNVKSMSATFYNCSNLTTVEDLSNWNTINVTSMWDMFNGCNGLTTIESLSNWNTSSVTTMQSMFSKCTSLTTIGDLGNWDTSNVENMGYMFHNCSSLTTIEGLSKWDTSNVAEMEAMFAGCTSLTTIRDLENWNTSSVTTMKSMFNGCTSLTTIGDLSNWDTSNVESMGYMFNNCSSLTTIEGLSNWNTSNVTIMHNMFKDCKNLVKLNLSNWDMSNVTKLDNMFIGCSSLEEIYTPAILPNNIEIPLPKNSYRDADIPQEGDISYNNINSNNEKFSKSVHLFKGIFITFDLDVANDYKIDGYDEYLKPRIFLTSEVVKLANTGGTEGYGDDLLPVTKDGKSILWDNERLENETGYEYIGWNSSYDNNIFQVPFSSSYFHGDVTYTATFGSNDVTYKLELTDVGKESGKPLPKAQFRIEGADRKTHEEKNYTTNENGTFIIENLKENEEYTLTEFRAGEGYKICTNNVKFKATKQDGKWKFEVIDGKFVEEPAVRTSTVKVKWEDEILFKVEKTDSETGEYLQGAKFTVKDETGNYAKDVYGNEVGTREDIKGENIPVITTNQNGLAIAEVNPGIYEITEVQAPFGYDLPENPVQNLEIKLTREEKLGVEEVWTTKFVSTSSDVIERVVLTKDGGRIFVGSIGDVIEGDTGGAISGGENLIVKYNKNGIRVWGVDFRYGYPCMVMATKDEGLLVVGRTGMVKYQKSGQGYEEEWDSTIFTSLSSTNFGYITETSDGGFTLAGITEANSLTLKDAETPITLDRKGNRDAFVVKYKKSGDTYIVEWADNIKIGLGNAFPSVRSVIETQDEGMLLGIGLRADITLPDGNVLSNGTGNIDNTALIKYDKNPDGDGYVFNWGVRIKGDRNTVTGISETTSGDYIVGGLANGTITLPNEEKLKTQQLDGFLVRFDKNGNIKYNFLLGGAGAEFINQVAVTNDDGFVTAGSMSSNITLDNGQEITTKGDRDAIVVRYDKNGHVKWAHIYGGNKMDYFTCINTDSDNNILVGMYFNSKSINLYNDDVLEGMDGNTDAAMIHLKEIVLESETIETEKKEFKNTKHLYNITTQVEGEGGHISGETDEYYEQVKYTENSQKDIIITPDNGYEIGSIIINDKEINFTTNDDGTVILDKFTNMRQDEHIIVKFTLKPLKIKTNEIIKTGTEVMKTEGESINYNISYQTEIEDHIGEARVTIIDYLPFAIDENNSALADGIYDEETKTITWVENIYGINTYVSGNKIIDINKQLTLIFKDINYEETEFINTVKSNLTIKDEEYTSEDTFKTGIYIEPVISQTKEVTTQKGNEYVVEGEKLTYTIKARNDGRVLKDIIIKDNIPEGTTFVEGSIKIDGVSEIYTKEELLEGITLEVLGKSEKILSFEVIVNELEEGIYFKQIKNTAIVDEEETNETIINVNKSNIVFEKSSIPEGNVKIGDEITYNVKIQNTGNLAETIKMEDSIPENTTYVPNSIKFKDKTYTDEEITIDNTQEQDTTKEKVILDKNEDGIIKIHIENLEIKPNEEVILNFKVTVNNNCEPNTKITNTAVINEKTTNTTENTVVKSIIRMEKQIKEIEHSDKANQKIDYVFKGDIITYNIKAMNEGNLGGYILVKDNIPAQVVLESESIKINGESSYTTPSGEIVNLKEKTEVDLANGIEIYVPEKQNEKAGETIISFSVKVKEEDNISGNIVNKAIWKETEEITEHETEETTVPIIVFEKQAEIVKSKLNNGKVTANDEIEYTILIQNTGTSDSKNFIITDIIPENTTIKYRVDYHDEYLNNGEINDNKIMWELSEIKAGETISIKFDVIVQYNKEQSIDIKNTAYINEAPTNETIIQYEKQVPQLSTQIAKSGDETSVIGAGIAYTIEYTGEIDQFVGKANIIIVDQLPYEIDEQKSNIGDGVYDNKTKTITWEMSAENIDTYQGERKQIVEITKELLLYYKSHLQEQEIENNVTATTLIIEPQEEKAVATDEVTSSHRTSTKQQKELPKTGGNGTIVFTVSGIILITIGISVLLIFVFKRKH